MSKAKDQGCKSPPEGWWCSRKPNHTGPCAARKKPKEKIVCPACKGEGFYFVEKYLGVDCYDDPKYYKSLQPCTKCTEIIRRKKSGYL